MYLIIGPDKEAGCKQNDVSHIHLDVYDIHLKFALNSHAHKLHKPIKIGKGIMHKTTI